MKHLIPDDPIIEVPYVAIDTETTGLNPAGGDRIVEVAALRFHRGNVLDSFTTLINPGMPVPYGAYRIHGITDDMLIEAPFFGDIYTELISFIGNDPTVYHNAPFDLSFLRNESKINRLAWVQNIVIDTLLIARKLKSKKDNRLGALADQFGAGMPGHRAVSDAHATGKILLALSFREGKHLTLSELIALSGHP